MVGYSLRLLHGNRKASKKRFGVRFGRHCIDSNISVIEVVEKLGVSRQSVYNWFKGGEVFVAYRPIVSALIQVMQTSGNAEEVWIRSVQLFNLNEQ